ncbi:MAG: mechanosensitive ion channel family protein [bacterium]|nr:mechanosensitive ion channel family protein [bacterium]
MVSFLIAQVGTSSKVSSSPGVLDDVLSTFSFLWNFALALAVILTFWALGKLIGARIIRALRQSKGDTLYPDMEDLIRRLAFYGAISTGGAVALQFIFDIDFLQVIGLFGLGISFAFKDLVENLIAGTVIILQNRFHIGDFIKVGGITGKIMEIQTRATILKGVDGTEIIIPNADLMSQVVTSYTAHHQRRTDFDISVSFKSDLEKAKKIAEEVMLAHDHVLKKPKPQVILKKLGEYAVVLSVRFWFDPHEKGKSWIATKSFLISEIKRRYDAEGIIIPFPTEVFMEKEQLPPEKA